MHFSEVFHLPLTDPLLIFLLLLGSAFIVQIVSRKTKIPDIIGLILIGMVIGPSGVGILQRNEILKLFSTVGLLLLLFLAGLEIDENTLKKNQQKSLIFGIFTFSFPLLFGFLGGYFLFRFNFLTSLLFASLFASHTPLTFSLLQKKKVSHDESVSTTIGGTVLTDIAALLILAITVAIYRGEFGAGLVLHMSLSFALFFLLTIFLLPAWVGILYRKLEKRDDLLFLFTLILVFGFGVLAEVSGIEPLVGAFLAGIGISRYIAQVSPLANRLHFFGNVLFIPAFLMADGMLIDPLSFLSDPRSLSMALFMTVCVLISKWLAAFFSSRLFGWNKAQQMVMFGLSIPQTAVTLAAVVVGYEIGMFDNAVLNGSIVMILLSVIIGSIITEKGADGLLSDSAPVSLSSPLVLISLLESPKNIQRTLELAVNLHETASVFVLPLFPRETTKDESPFSTLREEVATYALATGKPVEILLPSSPNIKKGILSFLTTHPTTDIFLSFSPTSSMITPKTLYLMKKILFSPSSPSIFIPHLTQSFSTFEEVVLLVFDNDLSPADLKSPLERVSHLTKATRASLVIAAPPKTLSSIQKTFSSSPSGIFFTPKETSDPHALKEIISSSSNALFVIFSLVKNRQVPFSNFATVFSSLGPPLKQKDYLFFFSTKKKI